MLCAAYVLHSQSLSLWPGHTALFQSKPKQWPLVMLYRTLSMVQTLQKRTSKEWMHSSLECVPIWQGRQKYTECGEEPKCFPTDGPTVPVTRNLWLLSNFLPFSEAEPSPSHSIINWIGALIEQHIHLPCKVHIHQNAVKIRESTPQLLSNLRSGQLRSRVYEGHHSAMRKFRIWYWH